MRKQTPVVMEVNPVRPPSVMPAPDSMNAVAGEHPKRDPMDMVTASSSMQESTEGSLRSRDLRHQRSGPSSRESRLRQ